MSDNHDSKIRLFLTVEERLYRDALLYELVHQKDIELVGESYNGLETLNCLNVCSPSTLVIEEDLKDTDGLTISEMALAQHPSLSIILLVDTEISQNRLAIYLDSGIKSVISKTQSIHDLSQAVNYTRNGQIFIDSERFKGTQKTVGHSNSKTHGWQSELFCSLSEREKEVATYIARHIPLNTIAEQLGVSQKTVHTYKERIFIKLGFQRLPELVVFMKRLDFALAREGNCL